MCGPSSSEQSIANSSASFATALQNNYATLFGQQQGVLNSINRSLSPILAAGPNQRGFSGAQTSALQTETINNAGAAARNALQAARNFGAGQGGGGTSGVTSGITKQIESGIASQAAQAEGAQLNSITQADFAQGSQNYWRAAGGLQQLGTALSPNAAASATVSEQGQAFGQANQINQENNQMEQTIAGAAIGGIGMLAGLPLPGLTENLGEAAGDFMKGGVQNLG